jgi:hypothetical protein
MANMLDWGCHEFEKPAVALPGYGAAAFVKRFAYSALCHHLFRWLAEP